jgi:hypothetical protein
MEQHQKFYVDKLKELIDYKIEQVMLSPDGYYGLQLLDEFSRKRKIIWFLRDEEDNGPGLFDIEDDINIKL